MFFTALHEQLGSGLGGLARYSSRIIMSSYLSDGDETFADLGSFLIKENPSTKEIARPLLFHNPVVQY